jgi:ABC-type phosphate transport system substrate-binding protein
LKKLIFTIIALLLATNLYAEEIVVIVNATGPLRGLEEGGVRDIYLGHITFLNGVKIAPLNHREGEVKDRFLKNLVRKTSMGYRRYWMRKSFQEGMRLPVTYKSFNQIVAKVKESAGAIGYLPASVLNDTAGIKVIITINER